MRLSPKWCPFVCFLMISTLLGTPSYVALSRSSLCYIKIWVKFNHLYFLNKDDKCDGIYVICILFTFWWCPLYCWNRCKFGASELGTQPTLMSCTMPVPNNCDVLLFLIVAFKFEPLLEVAIEEPFCILDWLFPLSSQCQKGELFC